MCSDALSKACEQVGRFMYHFALVENEVNESIIKLMDLKGDGATAIVHGVDFFKKLNILRTAALELADEKNKTRDIFNRLIQQNDNRTLIAHSLFESAKDGAVQFRRTVAKDGRVSKADPLWTKQQFENAYSALETLATELSQLRPTLVIDTSKGYVGTHYLYTPASTWVPTGDET